MQITNLIDQLLTREGGPLRASPILRDKVAIFADGRCLISRPNGEDVDVISLVALAGRLGVQLKAPEYVDLGSLRSLYADNDAGESGGPRISRDDTSMQREVFDLLFRARQEGASDIHLLVEQDMVTVQMRINGALMPMSSCGASGGELKWRPEHGRQICMTAYAMAAESGTADSSYDPFGFQAGRIVGGLPEGLQAVRLQFNPVGYSGRHMVMRLLYTCLLYTSDAADE